MRMSRVWKTLVLVLALQAAAMGMAEGVVLCTSAIFDILPYLSFVTGVADPTTACCNDVKTLIAAITSALDRQALCRCIKSAAASSSYDCTNVVNIPSLCGINVGVPITTSITCDA